MGFFLTFLKSQLFFKLPYPTWNFGGQTVVITGSNTGLGLEAARHIVRLGADKVILAVRTVSKGETAAEDIIRSTQAKKSVVEVWPLDLSDYESVKAFGARLQTLDRLDAFIQNAGVLSEQFTLSKQTGLETHIDINSVSSILVGLFALPKLKETSRKFSVRTRLCFVGSELHWLAQCKEAKNPGSLLKTLSDKEQSDMSDR
jgi:NAD(P)-dependent dehydrogenase (short-subunit alcohol dehydrogenase family)